MLRKRYCIFALCCVLMLLCLASAASAKKTVSVPPLVVSWQGALSKLPELSKDFSPLVAEAPYARNEEIIFVLQLLVLPAGFEDVTLQIWSDELNMRQSKPVLLRLDAKNPKTTALSFTRITNGFTLPLNAKNAVFEPASSYMIAFTARNACESDGVVHARISGGAPATLGKGDAIIQLQEKYLRVHKEALTEPFAGLEGEPSTCYTLSYMDGIEVIRIITSDDGEILGFAKMVDDKLLPVHYNLSRKRYVTSGGDEVIQTRELQSLFKDLSISFLRPLSEDALLAIAGYQSQTDFSFHSVHSPES